MPDAGNHDGGPAGPQVGDLCLQGSWGCFDDDYLVCSNNKLILNQTCLHGCAVEGWLNSSSSPNVCLPYCAFVPALGQQCLTNPIIAQGAGPLMMSTNSDSGSVAYVWDDTSPGKSWAVVQTSQKNLISGNYAFCSDLPGYHWASLAEVVPTYTSATDPGFWWHKSPLQNAYFVTSTLVPSGQYGGYYVLAGSTDVTYAVSAGLVADPTKLHTATPVPYYYVCVK